MSRKPSTTLIPEFPLVSGKTLEQHLEIGEDNQQKWRAKLPKGIYWFQPVPRGTILYNLKLWQDYIINGEGKEHDRLVEQFIKSVQHE